MSQPKQQASVIIPVGTRLENAECRLILATLEATDGRREEAARLLGISPRTLRNKLRIYSMRGTLEAVKPEFTGDRCRMCCQIVCEVVGGDMHCRRVQQTDGSILCAFCDMKRQVAEFLSQLEAKVQRQG